MDNTFVCVAHCEGAIYKAKAPNKEEAGKRFLLMLVENDSLTIDDTAFGSDYEILDLEKEIESVQ